MSPRSNRPEQQTEAITSKNDALVQPSQQKQEPPTPKAKEISKAIKEAPQVVKETPKVIKEAQQVVRETSKEQPEIKTYAVEEAFVLGYKLLGERVRVSGKAKVSRDSSGRLVVRLIDPDKTDRVLSSLRIAGNQEGPLKELELPDGQIVDRFLVIEGVVGKSSRELGLIDPAVLTAK